MTGVTRSSVDTVRAFRRLRALVIGDAMLDSYLEGTASRLCREGPVPVVRKTCEEHVPGGASNTAANLRALGAEVAFLGVIGQDAPGRTLRSALEAAGVECRWLVEDPASATHHKQRILAAEQYVVRFDAGDTSLSPQIHRTLLANLERAFAWCDLIVASDYSYGVLSAEMISRITDLRMQRPCVLVVDAKDLGRFRRARATLVTPNHVEAMMAVDRAAAADAPARLPDLERTGRALLDTIDTEMAAITMAGDGVLLLDREQITHLPAYPVARANDVGAGDSFTAAAALALGAGAAPEDAVRIGIEAGGIAVTKRRTAVVRHQELLQRVSLHDAELPLTVDTLAQRLEEERRSGRTIVFTNGVFDILHAGHVHFLREAKHLGDVLVVGINSDRSARRLKGKNRPINQERDRLSLVAALDPVDHVIVFDDDVPSTLIRALRPDIHVKGGDYAGETLPEADAVCESGGRVIILPLHEKLSTSTVIERIVNLAVV